MTDSKNNLVSLVLKKITITSLMTLVFFILLYAYGNYQDFLDSTQFFLLNCVSFLSLFVVLVGTLFFITELTVFFKHKKKIYYSIYLFLFFLFDIIILGLGLFSLSIIVLSNGTIQN